MPNVQKLRKDLCDAQVSLIQNYCSVIFQTHPAILSRTTMQSHDESQIPDSLLERLLEGRSEFPPVCAVIGGVLGQVINMHTNC